MGARADVEDWRKGLVLSERTKEAVLELEPREVFSRFAEISAIPRGSGCEKAVSDHILRFAEERGLEAWQDESGNLLVRKPGGHGMEAAPPVILQAHLDMVWVKEPGSDFDFAAMPIELIVDGGMLRARGTTLGADDGIGVAYMLALLDAADIPHPPIEAVFTVAEETGMDGALCFDVSRLTGLRCVNIDSEEEGIFYASCCGGARIDMKLPAPGVSVTSLELSGRHGFHSIAVGGLRGGHSGVEIDKGLGNANRLLGRVLFDLDTEFGIHLCGVGGGIADNAIPAAAEAVVLIRDTQTAAVRERLGEWNAVFIDELAASDGKPDAAGAAFKPKIDFVPAGKCAEVFAASAQKAILAAMVLIPTGVEAMDMNGDAAERIPESSQNFAIVSARDGQVVFSVSLRSSLASKLEFMEARLRALAGVLGGDVEKRGEYPGWRYDPESAIRKVFVEAFRRIVEGREASIAGIHAGLECGVFARKYLDGGRKLDLISIGPDLRDVHTPQESLDIASAGRTWELLKTALGMMGT